MEGAAPDGGLPAAGNPAANVPDVGPSIEEPRAADARSPAEIADAAAREAALAEETERRRAAAITGPPKDPIAEALAGGPSAPSASQDRGREGTEGKRGRGRGRGRTPGAGRGRSRTPKTRLKGPTLGVVPRQANPSGSNKDGPRFTASGGVRIGAGTSSRREDGIMKQIGDLAGKFRERSDESEEEEEDDAVGDKRHSTTRASEAQEALEQSKKAAREKELDRATRALLKMRECAMSGLYSKASDCASKRKPSRSRKAYGKKDRRKRRHRSTSNPSSGDTSDPDSSWDGDSAVFRKARNSVESSALQTPKRSPGVLTKGFVKTLRKMIRGRGLSRLSAEGGEAFEPIVTTYVTTLLLPTGQISKRSTRELLTHRDCPRPLFSRGGSRGLRHLDSKVQGCGNGFCREFVGNGATYRACAGAEAKLDLPAGARGSHPQGGGLAKGHQSRPLGNRPGHGDKMREAQCSYSAARSGPEAHIRTRTRSKRNSCRPRRGRTSTGAVSSERSKTEAPSKKPFAFPWGGHASPPSA